MAGPRGLPGLGRGSIRHSPRASPACPRPLRTVSFRSLRRTRSVDTRAGFLNETIATTDLPAPLLRRGKVRDVYDLGDSLLMIATDRVSAFDVVLPQAVPRKGEVLTLISAWWFGRTSDLVPNHLITVDPDEIVRRKPELDASRALWARRAMLVRKLKPFPIECVVRGYIAGSAWKEYRESGTLAGEPLPSGLV